MLAIDIGNSRIKWAIFNVSDVQSYAVREYTAENFSAVLNEFELPDKTCAVMVSLVARGALRALLTEWLLAKGFGDVRFARTHNEQCGIVNSYAAPENMGVDRWLAVIAAFEFARKKSSKAVCVIDCGTAITVDVVSAQGAHLGGLILPGYRTMLRSLVDAADNIKDHALFKGVPTGLGGGLVGGLGVDTPEAIVQGCTQQIVFGLSGVVAHQKKVLSADIACFVTGGDGEWVSALLSASLGVENKYYPHLVLQGLYEVYKKDGLPS